MWARGNLWPWYVKDAAQNPAGDKTLAFNISKRYDTSSERARRERSVGSGGLDPGVAVTGRGMQQTSEFEAVGFPTFTACPLRRRSCTR